MLYFQLTMTLTVCPPTMFEEKECPGRHPGWGYDNTWPLQLMKDLIHDASGLENCLLMMDFGNWDAGRWASAMEASVSRKRCRSQTGKCVMTNPLDHVVVMTVMKPRSAECRGSPPHNIVQMNIPSSGCSTPEWYPSRTTLELRRRPCCTQGRGGVVFLVG